MYILAARIMNKPLIYKQQYDKTRKETEIIFLINAYCFAVMGPGFH